MNDIKYKIVWDHMFSGPGNRPEEMKKVKRDVDFLAKDSGCKVGELFEDINMVLEIDYSFYS